MWFYFASAIKSKTRFDQARTEAFLTMTTWTVYIVRCADDTLYTGIARDAARRVEEHNSNDLLAARYTRTRRPVALVYEDVVATRSDALKHEYRIKQMTRKEKEKLIMKP